MQNYLHRNSAQAVRKDKSVAVKLCANIEVTPSPSSAPTLNTTICFILEFSDSALTAHWLSALSYTHI